MIEGSKGQPTCVKNPEFPVYPSCPPIQYVYYISEKYRHRALSTLHCYNMWTNKFNVSFPSHWRFLFILNFSFCISIFHFICNLIWCLITFCTKYHLVVKEGEGGPNSLRWPWLKHVQI